jgi:hypothetical protein
MLNKTDDCRPFLISDGLILVAATAFGLAGCRALSSGRAGWGMLYLVGSLLTAWSLGLVVLRIRGPRPSTSVLFLQPGFTACLAAGVPAAFLQLCWAVTPVYAPDPFAGSIYLCGFAVSALWSAKLLERSWNSEPGWIDRAGIVLGACWVGLFLLLTAFAFLALIFPWFRSII